MFNCLSGIGQSCPCCVPQATNCLLEVDHQPVVVTTVSEEFHQLYVSVDSIFDDVIFAELCTTVVGHDGKEQGTLVLDLKLPTHFLLAFHSFLFIPT